MKASDKQLNQEQKKAVEFGLGPLLIIAGAGTGKTTVVTERIKYLIAQKKVKPAEILALTFTEKAAREMEIRVDQALPYGYTQLWISTFHSFCDRILRAEAIHIGLTPNYHLLSAAESTMLLRKHLFAFDLDYFRPLGNPNKFLGAMLTHFSRLQDEDITPSQYVTWIKKSQPKANRPLDEKVQSQKEELLEIQKYAELAKAYHTYEKLKIKEGLMDFADLITNTLELFRKRPNIAEQYRKQFAFLLIDEFQDTNVAQYELIKLLAPPKLKPNITVVGDDNQSIYKFRGAAISNILNFKKDYPKAQQVILNQNYRSYQFILDGAYKLIKHNDPDTLESRLGISKKLVSTRSFSGSDKIGYIHVDRVENEAEAVVKKIKDIRQKTGDGKWSDFAILVRANTHAEAFVRALVRSGIPYQFLGPGQLFRQSEIKELISYLQVLANFEDDVAWYRVLSMEYFGIPGRDLVALTNTARKLHRSLFEASELIIGEWSESTPRPHIASESIEKLSKIVTMVNRHLELLTKETAGQILYFFLEDSGLLTKILEYQHPLDERSAGNIMKFFNKLKTYEAEHEDASVTAVLDWILLSMELGESPAANDMDWQDNDAVNILTVHSAKGLEFPVVFLVNLVGQRFPTRERREPIPIPESLIKETLPQGDFHLQEERRLFYVGMTRARDQLFLTAADFYGEGKREKKLSPFIFEALGTDPIPLSFDMQDAQLSLLEWKKVETQVVKPLPSVEVSYLSYSQIDMFRFCPLHYKLKYILGVAAAASAALSFGTSIHEVLKVIYTQLPSKKISKSEIKKLLQAHWVSVGYINKIHEDQMFSRGLIYIHQYLEKTYDPRIKILTLEEPFETTITNEQRVLKIGGRIDRIDDLGDGKIEIIDYKTGSVPRKLGLETNLQLSIYALAATTIPQEPFGKKCEQITLSLYYLDSQEKFSTTRSQEQLETARQELFNVANEIETSDFRCSGNDLCIHCEYKLFCASHEEG